MAYLSLSEGKELCTNWWEHETIYPRSHVRKQFVNATVFRV